MTLKPTLTALLIATSFLSACGESTQSDSINNEGLSLRLQLPDSLTGGSAVARNRDMAHKIADIMVAAKGGTGEPCGFIGSDDDSNPFQNGYSTTRFLVSSIATWTCIADLLIDLADVVVHDGMIVATDNDTLAPDYEADDPTHYSVTDDSERQVTIRMYYGYDRANPPVPADTPAFYLSWNEAAPAVIAGKMIIDASVINQAARDHDDPAMMRMDFDFGEAMRSADMFLRFDQNNPWARGFRIQIDKDLNASPLGQVFTARGLLEMTGQFLPVSSISETPDIRIFAVSDRLGNGAAIGEILNVSLPLVVNLFQGNHLGNYLFSKRDVYFFEDDRDWEYIHKAVNSSEYRGARTTPASGGSWLSPFNPSLDLIVDALALPGDYFTGSQCAQIGDDCNSLLNAVFGDGFAGQEQNQGSDPMDWRSTALDNADFLPSIFPNGLNWDNAFDQSFTPAL